MLTRYVSGRLNNAIVPIISGTLDLGHVESRFNSLYLNQSIKIVDTEISTDQTGQLILNSSNGTITVTSNLATFLGSVDTTTNALIDGQVLVWNSGLGLWRPGNVALGGAGQAGSGVASVTVANIVPATTTEGSLWLDSNTGDLSIFYSNNWIEVNSSTGVLISNVIPAVNESGRLWFDTDTGDVSVSVGNAWVELSPVEGSPSSRLKPLFAFNYINS